MMYKPSNLDPEFETLDVTIDNTFTFSNNGDQMNYFRLYIYNNNTGSLEYDSGKITSTTESKVISASTLTVDINYKWRVDVSNDDVTYVSSDYVFFKTATAPTVSIALSSSPVYLQDPTFTATITLATGVYLQNYRFYLYDNDSVIIEDSGDIYNRYSANHQFDALLEFGNSYRANCTILDQNNMTAISNTVDFTISATPLSATPIVTVTEVNSEAANSITWTNPLSESVESYNIERKESTDNYWVLIQSVTEVSGTKTVKDYSARNGIAYTYGAFPILLDGREGNSGRDTGTLDFVGWAISDITELTCYVFNISLETSNIEINDDVKIYNNYMQYTVTSRGLRRYKTGTITTVPYSYVSATDTYTIDRDLLDNIIDFLNSDNPKILRNMLGEVMEVTTSGANYKYMDTIEEQPYTISFKFTQTGTGSADIIQASNIGDLYVDGGSSGTTYIETYDGGGA